MSTGIERQTGPVDEDALEALIGERAIGRDDHLNAPAFVINPDQVQSVLSDLKEQAGYDHLSCVTAQDYADRYESIYHLKKYADPTDEVSIVVPTTKTDPISQSAEPVFRTADWHEREAYDLVASSTTTIRICAASSCLKPGRDTRFLTITTRRSHRSLRSRNTRTRLRLTTTIRSRIRCS